MVSVVPLLWELATRPFRVGYTSETLEVRARPKEGTFARLCPSDQLLIACIDNRYLGQTVGVELNAESGREWPGINASALAVLDEMASLQLHNSQCAID